MNILTILTGGLLTINREGGSAPFPSKIQKLSLLTRERLARVVAGATPDWGWWIIDQSDVQCSVVDSNTNTTHLPLPPSLPPSQVCETREIPTRLSPGNQGNISVFREMFNNWQSWILNPSAEGEDTSL